MTWLADLLPLIAALGGLTGVAAIVSAIVTARTTARQADVAALVLTCQTLQATVGALETENRRLYDCVERLEQAQAADHGQIDDLRAQVERLQAENRRLRARVADLERENADLRAQLLGLPVPAAEPGGGRPDVQAPPPGTGESDPDPAAPRPLIARRWPAAADGQAAEPAP